MLSSSHLISLQFSSMNRNLLISVFSFLCIHIFAQSEANFLVTVSTDSVLMENYFEVTFTIENAKAKQFKAPGFNGFDIVGGPNQSSMTSYTNGAMTSTTSYSYYLQPRYPGIFFIESASIQVDGEFLETLPIEILVVENPDGIIQNPSPRNQSDSFFDFSFPRMDMQCRRYF